MIVEQWRHVATVCIDYEHLDAECLQLGHRQVDAPEQFGACLLQPLEVAAVPDDREWITLMKSRSELYGDGVFWTLRAPALCSRSHRN